MRKNLEWPVVKLATLVTAGSLAGILAYRAHSINKKYLNQISSSTVLPPPNAATSDLMEKIRSSCSEVLAAGACDVNSDIECSIEGGGSLKNCEKTPSVPYLKVNCGAVRRNDDSLKGVVQALSKGRYLWVCQPFKYKSSTDNCPNGYHEPDPAYPEERFPAKPKIKRTPDLTPLPESSDGGIHI